MLTGWVYHRHLALTELAGKLVGCPTSPCPPTDHHQRELVLRSLGAALQRRKLAVSSTLSLPAVYVPGRELGSECERGPGSALETETTEAWRLP